MSDDESREFWKYVDQNYFEVIQWPQWMRGGEVATPKLKFYPKSEDQ